MNLGKNPISKSLKNYRKSDSDRVYYTHEQSYDNRHFKEYQYPCFTDSDKRHPNAEIKQKYSKTTVTVKNQNKCTRIEYIQSILAFNQQAALQQAFDNFDQNSTYDKYVKASPTPPKYQNTAKLHNSRWIEVFTNASNFLQYGCGLNKPLANNIIFNVLCALNNEKNQTWEKIQTIVFNCAVGFVDYFDINRLVDRMAGGTLEKLADQQWIEHNVISRHERGLQSLPMTPQKPTSTEGGQYEC